MTRTVSQTNFERLNPKVTHYQGYEKLCNLRFGEYLLLTLLFENLILTSVNLKSSSKYVSRLWTILHHVRKNTLDRKQAFHEQNFETRQDEKKWFQKQIFQKQV